MKKISYLEIGVLVIVEVVTLFSGINFNILKQSTGINSWLTVLISYIIGFISILLVLYIANYKPELKLNEKINSLFGSIFGTIINIILSLILIALGITLLYNINNFILSQFLFRTPFLLSCILFTILIVYTANKGINTIVKTSLLLLVINIFLYLINIIGLIPHVDLSNFHPLLTENTKNILPTALKLAGINTLPLITILIIQKDRITKKDTYNKTIIISYIIGCLLSFGIILTTFGTLGINLVNAFEYPEYIALRKIKLLGFLERIENIVSLQWITGTYIYLTIIVYTISKSIPINSKKAHLCINTLIGLILITLTIYIFKNNTIFNTYIKTIFPYITVSIILIYIIIIIKIIISKAYLGRE